MRVGSVVGSGTGSFLGIETRAPAWRQELSDGLNAGFDGVAAVPRAPAVGTIGQSVSDERYTGTLVRAARLAPTGITSTPFATTGILELGRPELPSTIGTSEQLDLPCLLEWPESPNLLLGVVLLGLLGNMCLTVVTS